MSCCLRAWLCLQGGRKPASVNGHTAASGRLSNEAIDSLAATLEAFVDMVGEIPRLWKADIDAAFRRVPIRPEHRWACGIAFVVDQEVCVCVYARASP